jgi:signal-transduction protein with cAMP-binding, CBS, and nucleotidyltransferase domain
MMETLKIYLFGLPYCLGILTWHTLRLRPKDGLYEAMFLMISKFYTNLAVYKDGQVVHLFNDEEELMKSMKQYVESESIKTD